MLSLSLLLSVSPSATPPPPNSPHKHIHKNMYTQELLGRLKNDEISGTWGVTSKEIDFKKLFNPSKDGLQSFFVRGLMEQLVADRCLYLMDIILHMQRRRSSSAEVRVSERHNANSHMRSSWLFFCPQLSVSCEPARARTHTYTRIQCPPHTNSHIHTHTHTYTHIHSLSHTHTHTCSARAALQG